jgi:prepilin-type N-terminal cleavage/methylation domain-containing protein
MAGVLRPRSRPEGGTAAPWRNRKGYTLVERLVALTIFAVGTAGVVSMLTVASRGIRHAEVSFWAALLASTVTSPSGVAAEGGEGEEATELGTYRWRRLSPAGVEILFDGRDPGSAQRTWRVEPAGTGEGPP